MGVHQDRYSLLPYMLIQSAVIKLASALAWSLTRGSESNVLHLKAADIWKSYPILSLLIPSYNCKA